MLELFRGLAAEGKCLLVSSHELEELEKLTDHVAILARGRIAAVGTVTQIRDMLDDQPLSVRIDAADPRRLATLLVNRPDVVGVDLGDGSAGTLVVRARNPRRFFEDFGRMVVSEEAGHHASGTARRVGPRGAGVLVGRQWEDVSRLE